MHAIKFSISHTRWFNKQSDMAQFLDIKNSSKKAISSRCRQWGYGLSFDDYYGEYNIELY